MSNKKFLATLVVSLSILFNQGCNDSNEASTATNNNHLKVGVCPGPYGKLFNDGIAPILKEKGYTVEIVEFTDYVQPDLALESGDINVNLMQHQEYFDNIVKTQNFHLKAISNVPTLGMLVFSEKVTDLNNLPKGAKVALPSDSVNYYRALKLLSENNLIKVNNVTDVNKVKGSDIVENPYELEFVQMEAAQIPRSFDSVELALVPGNYALASNLDLSKALAQENVAEGIKNIVAVKEGNEKLEKDLFLAIRSEQFKKYINENDSLYKSFSRPNWWDKE